MAKKKKSLEKFILLLFCDITWTAGLFFFAFCWHFRQEDLHNRSSRTIIIHPTLKCYHWTNPLLKSVLEARCILSRRKVKVHQVLYMFQYQQTETSDDWKIDTRRWREFLLKSSLLTLTPKCKPGNECNGSECQVNTPSVHASWSFAVYFPALKQSVLQTIGK